MGEDPSGQESRGGPRLGTMTIVSRLARHFRRKDLREALVEASREPPGGDDGPTRFGPR